MNKLTRKFIRKDITRASVHVMLGNFWAKVCELSNMIFDYSLNRSKYHANKAETIVKLVSNDMECCSKEAVVEQ